VRAGLVTTTVTTTATAAAAAANNNNNNNKPCSYALCHVVLSFFTITLTPRSRGHFRPVLVCTAYD